MRIEAEGLVTQESASCQAFRQQVHVCRSEPQSAESTPKHPIQHLYINVPTHSLSKGEVENSSQLVDTWIRVNDPSAGSPTER